MSHEFKLRSLAGNLPIARISGGTHFGRFGLRWHLSPAPWHALPGRAPRSLKPSTRSGIKAVTPALLHLHTNILLSCDLFDTYRQVPSRDDSPADGTVFYQFNAQSVAACPNRWKESKMPRRTKANPREPKWVFRREFPTELPGLTRKHVFDEMHSIETLNAGADAPDEAFTALLTPKPSKTFEEFAEGLRQVVNKELAQLRLPPGEMEVLVKGDKCL